MLPFVGKTGEMAEETDAFEEEIQVALSDAAYRLRTLAARRPEHARRLTILSQLVAHTATDPACLEALEKALQEHLGTSSSKHGLAYYEVEVFVAEVASAMRIAPQEAAREIARALERRPILWGRNACERPEIDPGQIAAELERGLESEHAPEKVAKAIIRAALGNEARSWIDQMFRGRADKRGSEGASPHERERERKHTESIHRALARQEARKKVPTGVPTPRK